MAEKELHALNLPDPEGFHRRLKRRKRVIQAFEAKENAHRTHTERLADFLTTTFGSIGFLTANVIFFVFWLLINTGSIPGIRIYDPFPFGLLTTIVSLEAICLAIIVLISQNRAAKIDDVRDEVALQIDTIAEEQITKMMELQVKILKKHGIDVSNDQELQQMLEPTDTVRIEKELEKQFQ